MTSPPTTFIRKYDRSVLTPLLLAACSFAEDGWPVFPVRLNDDATKKPLTAWRKGTESQRASVDPDRVQAWWKEFPRAGIGVETGSASGLFVLDVDGEAGAASLAALIAEHGPLPETLIAVTPRGGKHYLFSFPGGKTSAGQLGTGLDTRGDGGMFVVPPSARPDGKAYVWVDAAAQPAPAPAWLLALCGASRPEAGASPDGARQVHAPPAEYVAAAFEDDLSSLRSAPAGTRNAALNVAAYNAGRLITTGLLDEGEARDRLTTAALAVGLSAVETTATLASGLKKGKATPLKLEQIGASDNPDAAVLKELARLRARQEATRLFRAEQYASRAVVLPRLTLKEALAAERPVEPPMRVSGLHRIGHNTTVSAAFKTGKTTLGGNLIRALADDGVFLDRFTVRPPIGRIGLLNYELTEGEMLDWLDEQGIANADRIAVLNLRGVPFSLTVDQHRDELVAWCRAMDVEVLHLDPHRRAFAGFGEENSNDDVNRFTEALDELKADAGVQDLFLYVHMGRSSGEPGSEHARGATALDDWADQRWVLTKDEHQDRFFYADGRLPYVPEFRLSYDAAMRRLSAEEGNRRENGLDKHKAAVLAGLGSAGTAGALVGEMERKLGITKRGALSKAVAALLAEGLIVQRTEARNAKRNWLPEFAPEVTP